MILFIALLLIALLFEIAGDVYFKHWAVGNDTKMFLSGALLYLIGGAAWGFSLKYESLSKAISVFTIANLLIVVIIGALYFKEHLSTTNMIGIGLGITSLVLIEM